MSVVESGAAPAELLERIRLQEKELETLRASLAAWEGAAGRAPARDANFTSISGVPVEPLYTPLDRPAPSPAEAAFSNETAPRARKGAAKRLPRPWDRR